MTVNKPFEVVLQQLIAKGAPSVQIALKSLLQPIGRGRLEVYSQVVTTDDKVIEPPPGLYCLQVEAMLPQPSPINGMPPTLTKVTLPMIFSAEDVLWVSEGMLNDKGEPMVIDMPQRAPAPPRGGLHVG